MRASFQKCVPLALAAFYSALALFGQTLHALPWLDHFSTNACEHCSCGLNHDDSPFARYRQTIPSGDQRQPVNPQPVDDCPICALFALSQDRPAPRPLVVVAGLATVVAPAIEPRVPYAPGRAPRSRGPPAAPLL
ncbi:hypothetical protein Pla123a_39030 [Posidoniimonas polymericola]|uniref:DUF2946 domain-containing protein n=1 Tax=Posidoniimonas polymericola TaxID=2528002 RepID=A0A5C5YCY0_9BACT|nr:hypothetical protein Pla123a_39030 [Posidoniimonas polymericola]